MQIWPAIDLRGGKCVRLRQGDYNRETVFGDDPAEMAQRWVDEGAQFLHLVDLDGARDGTLANRQAVAAILKRVSIPCELGGGIRDERTIQHWVDAGLSRLVVGTKALKEPDWFSEMCAKFPNRLALGLDARDGFVATDGWLETRQAELARPTSPSNLLTCPWHRWSTRTLHETE
jgi:phosphoribosylformimino-5-aminoimidazole carboxamide ribotide isomerase